MAEDIFETHMQLVDKQKSAHLFRPNPRCCAMSSRRFPVPWTAEETDACFFVGIHNGLAVAYVYIEGG
jgi:hypothetical protein